MMSQASQPSASISFFDIGRKGTAGRRMPLGTCAERFFGAFMMTRILQESQPVRRLQVLVFLEFPGFFWGSHVWPAASACKLALRVAIVLPQSPAFCCRNRRIT